MAAILRAGRITKRFPILANDGINLSLEEEDPHCWRMAPAKLP
jgi:hypothetical protein